MSLHAVNIFLSDAALLLLLMCLALFAVDAWRIRNGAALRRFAEFALALFLWFGWFTVLYLDSRFPALIPGDLTRAMDIEWRWPVRLLVIVAFARLWCALRFPGGVPWRGALARLFRRKAEP